MNSEKAPTIATGDLFAGPTRNQFLALWRFKNSRGFSATELQLCNSKVNVALTDVEANLLDEETNKRAAPFFGQCTG
jgi:hypothetical protein